MKNELTTCFGLLKNRHERQDSLEKLPHDGVICFEALWSANAA
jgi:hypothetical protein